MSKISVCHKLTWVALIVGTILVALHTSSTTLHAQTTISTGSILGTVTDQSGAVVPGAKVTILNKATGQAINLTSTSTGTYNSGALLPGDYTVRVQAQGFQTFQVPLTVQVGVTANGNVTLTVGSTSTVVQVESNPVAVNTEQATVQGTITTQQIEELPINGRNFLDLAQLQPGVQIQDGAVFDPTKNGFSSISFGGRYGRTARIEVDGVDVSDETVGTTTINIPASGIQEFQVEQSSLDLSTELTSSGAVNVTTRSGTNTVHGEAFGYGRWHNAAARISPLGDLFFRREQFGTNVGGPIKKDKLFFFLDWERTRQDLAAPVLLSSPFNALSTSVNQPFKEHQAVGRLDWDLKPSVRAFYRFNYNINSNVVPFIPNTFSPFLNRDHTQDHVAGIDFNTGNYTHTIRFGFLRFANQITDATVGSGIFNPAPGIEIGIGGDARCITAGFDDFCSGTNILAPQATQQTDLQFKYDGSTVHGSNVIRYGASVNRILGGGFASFFGLAPAIGDSFSLADKTAATKGPFPGGAANPLNYPVDVAILGNGEGFSTEVPRFNYPAGGQFDTRFSWYIGNDWKAKPNLTISYGVRYVRDTGRDDADLAAIPVLNQFGPGLGDRTHQPNKNFAPQVGVAWDPWKNGKTVIRAGAGIFYENAIFNNILFDRPARLQKGLFLGTATACPATLSGLLTLPNGATVPQTFCGQPIGAVASQLVALQQQYQAATKSVGASANAGYIGNALEDGLQTTGTNLIGPNYRTPYSVQMNVGFQRELKPGTVLTADFIRNVGLHYLLGYDTNHVGDARYLNVSAAMNAINATNQGFGCPLGTAGIGCAIAAGATISSYAGNGLDSGVNVGANSGFAFPGINPKLGENQMLFPIGRSVYDGMDVSLRQNLANPLPGLKYLSLQVSYSLSRFDAQANDQDFVNVAYDYNNISRYIGPDALDRTDQFSAGGVADLPGGLRLSLITHAYSSLPITLELPPGNSTATPVPSGAIFTSDLTGDGTVGDVLPGTNLGAFGRTVTASNINKYLTAYNNNDAGKLTPAGSALVNAGLFTQQQLVALGAVTPTLALAPQGEVGPGSLFTADLGLTWVFHMNKLSSRFGETFTIQPSVTAFNVTNSQNFDFANNILSGILQAQAAPGQAAPPGSANSTTYGQRTTHVNLGSGVYALGAPRVFEWGVKVNW